MKRQRKIIKRKHNLHQPQLTKQRGFTLVELIICIVGLGGLVLSGFLIYALCHFIGKFW